MKETRTELRRLLESDTDEVLRNTWYEYSDDRALPTHDKGELIEAIIDLMIEEGHAVEDMEPNVFSLPDLAREMDINPKVARDKFRKAKAKGDVPPTLKLTGWVFSVEHKKEVADIIKPRRAQ